MSSAREDTIHLAELLRREHHALADFLVALAEFHRERRWVELGHNSLFSFLVRELGLSKGAAFYRNRAAELLQEFPDVIEPLRDGRLCLSSVAELSNVLTAENSADVLPRFFHLSRSEAKEITAELRPDPAPPLRTVVTAVAAAASPSGAQAGFLGNLVRANSAVSDVAPPLAAPPAPRRAEVVPRTAELSRVHLTVPRRFLEKLAAARDALSHAHFGATDAEVLEVALDLVIDRHRKRRGIGAKPRKKAAVEPAAATVTESPAATPTSRSKRERSRHVPADVARIVWARDGGCCAFPLEGGGVCGSTSQLEIDHIDGWALGAGMTPEELRLACRFHQDVHARRLYGNDLMNRYTKPKGPRCSERIAAYAPPRSHSPSRSPGPSCPARHAAPRSGTRRGRQPPDRHRSGARLALPSGERAETPSPHELPAPLEILAVPRRRRDAAPRPLRRDRDILPR